MNAAIAKEKKDKMLFNLGSNDGVIVFLSFFMKDLWLHNK